MSELTSDIDQEACTCFINWQKAFDHANWARLLQILKNVSIDWSERRLIRILQYMDQNVGVQLHHGEKSSVKV
jgi:hypothetical protein